MLHELEPVICDICNADTLVEAAGIFSLYREELSTYRFIIATSTGINKDLAQNRNFSGTGAVIGLFGSDSLAFLDKRTLFEMEFCGKAQIPIDYSIGLDSNAMSYLWPYLEKGQARVKDFKEVFRFIARDEVNIDPMPYIYENLPNFVRPDSARNIFNTLKAYEILRTLDPAALENNDLVLSKLSSEEIEKRAQQLMSKLYYEKPVEMAGELLLTHQFVLAQLLQMTVIQLNKPSKSLADNKVKQFVDFCDRDLSSIDIRCVAIARRYFEQGQNFAFFNKIQKNREDIFDSLYGMAWDITHFRHLEKRATLRLNEESDYLLPAILTFDKGFVEMASTCSLKGLAFSTAGNEIFPLFKGDQLAIFSDNQKTRQYIFSRFYSPPARYDRLNRSKEAVKAIKETIAKLFSELSEAAGVPCRFNRQLF